MLRRLIFTLIAALTLMGVSSEAGSLALGAPFTVSTAKATVGGKAKQILVDGTGTTLYYLTSDTPAVSVCVGGCAGVWPPLLSSTAPTAPASLPGRLTVAKTGNGAQVAYNGHLLYRYAPDTKPGQVNGEGLGGPGGGTWHVAVPGLKVP